jgi:hypothetical protein
MIAWIINPEYPDLYAPTDVPVQLMYRDERIKIGFLVRTNNSTTLKKQV